MAKTRRTRRHKPAKKNRNINIVLMEQGARVQVSGHRTAEGSKMIPNAKAKPVFVGRTYTGVNRGKVYPYASKKRRSESTGPDADMPATPKADHRGLDERDLADAMCSGAGR